VEFILFAALVLPSWSERVRDTERAYALRGIAVLVMLVALLLFLPLPLPVLGVPVVTALIGLLVGATVANAQKRL
jgi:ABC-type Co2+ transport system permease subunit